MKWDAERYDSVKGPQVDAGRELIAMAGVSDTDSILDMGCGTGRLTIELARLVSNGSVVGIDPSGEMLERAMEKTKSIENISLRQVSAQSMSFTDEFDLIFSNSALQWIKEQKEVMRQVISIIKTRRKNCLSASRKEFLQGKREPSLFN